MADFLSKMTIPSAVGNSHLFRLQSQLLGTSNFFQLIPVYCRELIGSRDKSNNRTSIDFNHNYFIKAMPMQRPIMGSYMVHSRSFFVPMRVIWEPWHEFLANSPYTSGTGATSIPSSVPVLENSVIVNLFTDVNYQSLTWIAGTSSNYDYQKGGNFYILTSTGRMMIKVLEALGYKAVFDDTHRLEYSAMPLLAVAKIYLDYYFPNQYAHYSNYITVDSILKRQSSYSLTVSELQNILSTICWTCYDNDLYTSAFDNPTGPSNDVGSLIVSMNDPTSGSPAVRNTLSVNSNNQTPTITNNNSSNPIREYTQWDDSALHALTDYITRHRLVGSLSVQRLLAQYGVALDDKVMRRSVYVSHSNYPMQVGEVTSFAGTATTSLGDFAGQGSANGHESCSFETDEFGFFITLCSIVPEVGYVQGYDRQNLHLLNTDFYTPEFDGTLGNQAINCAEVVVSEKTPAYNADASDAVWGWSGMYYEYKTAKDRLVGDFRWDTINAGLLGFSTMREIAVSGYANAYAFKHNLGFVQSHDRLQYSQRVFPTGKDLSDVFINVHRFDVKIRQTAKPLFDTYDFMECDDSKKVQMDVNGARVN